jgi:two-component system, sensor histidine kinase and response regulator
VRYLHQVQASARHMTGLLNDVLFIARSEVGRVAFNPEPVDLVASCTDIVEEAQRAAPDECKIRFTHPEPGTAASVDEKLLHHVLGNLLSNAVKYSPDGGTIDLDLRCAEGQAIFRVSDQGIGILPTDQARLFEAFHRGANVGKISGTGLGLAIVKRAVDAHGGTISFTSRPGTGTTFMVCLPII